MAKNLKRFVCILLYQICVKLQNINPRVCVRAGWRVAGVKNNFCRSPPERLDMAKPVTQFKQTNHVVLLFEARRRTLSKCFSHSQPASLFAHGQRVLIAVLYYPVFYSIINHGRQNISASHHAFQSASKTFSPS